VTWNVCREPVLSVNKDITPPISVFHSAAYISAPERELVAAGTLENPIAQKVPPRRPVPRRECDVPETQSVVTGPGPLAGRKNFARIVERKHQKGNFFFGDVPETPTTLFRLRLIQNSAAKEKHCRYRCLRLKQNGVAIGGREPKKSFVDGTWHAADPDAELFLGFRKAHHARTALSKTCAKRT